MAGHMLEETPTWIVAAMCSFIVLPSLVAERCLHYLAKAIKRRHPKPLYRAFLKIKQELLQGFIALLLTVFQSLIQKTCISPNLADHMLPCRAKRRFTGRLSSRMLSEDEHCESKGQVPFLSSEVIHDLEIFIFVLAVTHVTFSVSTMLLGFAKIRQWKKWEAEIQKDAARAEIQEDTTENGHAMISRVHQNLFIREHYKGFGRDSRILSWLNSFVKQFYGSVTKIDYATMRLGFIMTHCRRNKTFDFHKYMMRILQNDFKKVVGISWYMWIFVVIYLLLNINGWHTYFWMAFLPLLLLLAVGTKLQHIIAQLAQDVAEKHSMVEDDLVVDPSDDLFWFRRPRIILYLIHFTLFQNAFEIAFFFWILITHGLGSCILEKFLFLVPRLVIGVVIQFVCSYSTLPLYAIVTQMGSCYKKEIFNDGVQQGLQGWAQTVKKRNRLKHADTMAEPTNTSGDSIEMMRPAAAREGDDAGQNIE